MKHQIHLNSESWDHAKYGDIKNKKFKTLCGKWVYHFFYYDGEDIPTVLKKADFVFLYDSYTLGYLTCPRCKKLLPLVLLSKKGELDV